MADRIDVMISSTALDLPDHRKQVIEAILRMSMHPIAMEHLAAMSADAIDASLALVNEAEIYIGIFAHRYGYIPDSPKNPNKLSITELEYRRAVERDIPRLIFIMGDDHPITSKDLETNPEGAAKLLALKNELKTSYVVSFFNSPDQLREQAITALANFRQKDPGGAMHYISDIPKQPEPYIAHPYTLLQTTQLAGRQKEMNLLTDWVAKPNSEVYKARILNIVAIGGMGKSALTWKWFNDIAPHEMKPMAGALWWSFYESDARWENFIIRALAYVSGRAREDIEQNTNPVERENLLLKILNEQPFLLVLDGLERILVAYARMDAAYLADDELDEQTANRVAGALGLPQSAGQSFVGQHLLRKTADPRAGNFLRKLASVKASRILVSTRLYPADLQTVTGGTIPGSFAYFLLGLGDDDAIDLWRALGVSGSRDALLPMFQRFDNYPPLIRALAGEVSRFRRAPGDFDAWQKAHPDFNPFQVELVNVKSHVLYHALQGLDEKEMKILHTIAAFRMPASYDTLAGLMVEGLQLSTPAEEHGEDFDESVRSSSESENITIQIMQKLFNHENAFDAVLADLEDRGLLGWDRRSNRYDLHPIVRGVVWGGLGDLDRRNVYSVLQVYFNSVTNLDDNSMNSLEEFAPIIELFSALVGLKKYNDALALFEDRIWTGGAIYELGIWREMNELLELLFPHKFENLSHFTNIEELQAIWLIGSIAQFSGNVTTTLLAFPKSIDHSHVDFLLNSFNVVGKFRECELNSLLLLKSNEPSTLGTGFTFYFINQAYRGITPNNQLDKLVKFTINHTLFSFNSAYYAYSLLLLGNIEQAFTNASNAFIEATDQDDITRAYRVRGVCALEVNNIESAHHDLEKAIVFARKSNYVEEELYSLVFLAELERRRGNFDLAREYLADTWEACERAPYRLIHADGMNVLAQIERDAGNPDAAIAAATKAYELAWCDGISEDGEHVYAYWWGLQDAKKHLEELGAPIPKLPSFDPAAHEPLPEIDWDALLKQAESNEDE